MVSFVAVSFAIIAWLTAFLTKDLVNCKGDIIAKYASCFTITNVPSCCATALLLLRYLCRFLFLFRLVVVDISTFITNSDMRYCFAIHRCILSGTRLLTGTLLFMLCTNKSRLIKYVHIQRGRKVREGDREII